jgi:hypothetical protein
VRNWDPRVENLKGFLQVTDIVSKDDRDAANELSADIDAANQNLDLAKIHYARRGSPWKAS